MKRRLFTMTLLVVLAALAVATATQAAYISRATVNADRSVTIEWTLASTEVSNTALSVDCCVVHTWYGSDRSTLFTIPPLADGRHTITLEVLEMYWTNTDYGPAYCKPSTRPTYKWVCSWRRWTAVTIRVPSSASQCVVPRVQGMRIANARRQIRRAKCSLGTVTRVTANRPAGVVVSQRPKPGTQLPGGGPITLVVSGHTSSS